MARGRQSRIEVYSSTTRQPLQPFGSLLAFRYGTLVDESHFFLLALAAFRLRLQYPALWSVQRWWQALLSLAPGLLRSWLKLMLGDACENNVKTS
jgi:hypothetical protein